MRIDQECQVGIVGGGLCGLALAYELAKQGTSFRLVEAQEQFGGRILGLTSRALENARFDLGPSWFWPGQNKILGLIAELGLENLVYTQYSSGHAIYEAPDGTVRRGVSGISMQGSYRLRGGLIELINALVSKIQELGFGSCLFVNSQVNSLVYSNAEIDVRHHGGSFNCQRIVLALPPRVALSNIRFSPSLSREREDELTRVATWMAGHAKVIAEYDTPFWREDGLSGDAISHKGPLSEIHDASAESLETDDDRLAFALFGFLSTEPQLRLKHSDSLPELIRAQLKRLFGGLAEAPTRLTIQDWATNALTATAHDQHIPNHHTVNDWSTISEQEWDNFLIWSGSESAADHTNGYLEGALLACEQTLQALFASPK